MFEVLELALTVNTQTHIGVFSLVTLNLQPLLRIAYVDNSGFGSSGIKPMEKREGGGAHNWGTMKDDMEG